MVKILIFTLLFSNISYSQDITFPENFLFGVSNAPAQVEDGLDDPWMKFADSGGVRAFKNQAVPKEKIRFWSDTKTELDLASNLGVDIFGLRISGHR